MIRLTIPGREAPPTGSRVPGALGRGAALPGQPLDGIVVKRHFDLSPAARAATPVEATVDVADDELLALEMDDGFVLYTSAARLADDLERKAPGTSRGIGLRLDALRSGGPTSRGLGDWVVRALSIIGIDEGRLRAFAAEKAKEWLGDKLADVAKDPLSWAGTRLLLRAIEEGDAARYGLRTWASSAEPAPTMTAPAPFTEPNWSREQPILVFIHGTGSSTAGSFGALADPRAADDWGPLREKYGCHIYGFEHRTFSQSPIENALELARALPDGARLSVVTHSRGGLVGDLLCGEWLGEEALERYGRRDEKLADADIEDRQALRELRGLLAGKAFRIERYVRVACPARGTLLASAHLDAFLSILLHLIGLVPGLQGPVYGIVKRTVLQIVKNRTDPNLVPGIEAMLPESPLAALLGNVEPRSGVEIAVVAGDIEGGTILKRIGALLTDQLIFERNDNDLVVDTESMYGGVARTKGRYLFDQGADVSHFRYFENSRTRRALLAWLVDESPARLSEFQSLAERTAPRVRAARAAGVDQPVVILLPGIMGSHLKVLPDDRVWFDFPDLIGGGFEKLRYVPVAEAAAQMMTVPGAVVPDDLFGMFYDDLDEFLAASHDVRRFPYDWRRPLADSAARLAELLTIELQRTTQPVRLLTHSMGGLVVRMLIARHRAVWDAFVARKGARWIMLGTPNRGAHGAVEALLGLNDSVRKLARIDLANSMQQLLDLLDDMPGAVQLLPRTGFLDAGGSSLDYYSGDTWAKLKAANHDFWFGDRLGGAPSAELLQATKAAWTELDEDLPNVDCIAYVAGYGEPTSAGIEIEAAGGKERLRLVGTTAGDGTVTHASSILACLRDADRVWFMPTDHTGLVADEEGFPAILDLLQSGTTTKLRTAPPEARAAGPLTFTYEPGPVLYPTEESLARSILGGRRAPRRTKVGTYTLRVSCRASDLQYALSPVLVGHYAGDAISGAEAVIDRNLDRALTMRSHLGQYAGPRGSATAVLVDQSADDEKTGRHRGVVVVGLGDYDGRLTPTTLTECVRAGVIRFLMQIVDRDGGRSTSGDKPREFALASLLLGYNSTTGITIDDSVQAVVRGVMEANREFREASGRELRVTSVEFIELFLHRAVSAAQAVRVLGDRLGEEAKKLGCRLEPAQLLERHWSGRVQHDSSTKDGYWPRLLITDADHEDDDCPPECREPRLRRRIDECPPECLDDEARAQASEPRLPTHPSRRPTLAQRLRFVLVSRRARSEVVIAQRQPGLAETLVERSIGTTSFSEQTAQLSRTLFHLLVPLDLKDAVRQGGNLVLVVDGYTANLPWEMLVAGDEPLVKNTAIVRQFQTSRFRRQVLNTLAKTALVVGDPSTDGFYRAFPDPQRADRTGGLPPLAGAEAEAATVRQVLESSGYEIARVPANPRALDVINALFQKGYRILHIAAHGMFQAGEGASARTGVVLSDGLLLTAAEIGQLDVVPDLVFLNCCFLGQTDNRPTAYNRLAYSVARELIEIGVRAVVVAGWAVDDAAARCFAETFYTEMVRNGTTFGRAVHRARAETLKASAATNTWGAYQAYGDPDFLLDPGAARRRGDGDETIVAPEQLTSAFDELWAQAHEATTDAARAALRKRIDKLCSGTPVTWRDRADVLYAQARAYAEIRAFADAIRCYRAAVATDDQDGSVPLRALEQLANLEARAGIDPEAVHQAIGRLLALVSGTSPGREDDGGISVSDTRTSDTTSERAALLGSAYKRLAALLEHWESPGDDPRQPRSIREALRQSIEWYGRAEGVPGQSSFRPYNRLNRLALQAVLGEALEQGAALAREAGEAAVARFATSRDYWDRIMGADALLAASLFDGSLAGERAEDAKDAIVERYAAARESAPESARQFDSVVCQIDTLAQLLERRGDPPATRAAASLRNIAADIRNGTSSAGRT